MWRSHTTNDTYGHCDIWHTSDHQSTHPSSILVQTTPNVLLLEKGRRTSYHRLILCDRPYSPFSGYYDQQDVYVGCEYDIFGGEADSPSLSSSLSSTTLEDPMDTLCDDPFSLPQEDLPAKRIQQDEDANQHGHKRHRTDYLTHHDDLVDYPSSLLFSPHPQSVPVDSILEYS